MDNRLKLHDELLKFTNNVYFQPPASIRMDYPCIVYNKSGQDIDFGNNSIYLAIQRYSITVMERDPDSKVAEKIQEHFQHCIITGYMSPDNIHHTQLSIYY